MERKITILKPFFEDPNRKFSIRELSRILRINHTTVRQYLNKLVKEGFLSSKKEGLFALRDFEAFDEKERRVALATSSWMMIDFKERRPVRLPEFLADYENHMRGRAIDDPFDRLPELQEVHAEKSFQVRLSDLDMNQHVNSTIYLDWALEAVPDEIRKKYRPGGQPPGPPKRPSVPRVKESNNPLSIPHRPDVKAVRLIEDDDVAEVEAHGPRVVGTVRKGSRRPIVARGVAHIRNTLYIITI